MIAAIIVVCACASVAITMRYAVALSPERLLDRSLANRLGPFAGSFSKAKYNDKEELWKEIGGLRGVVSLCIGAAAINELAAQKSRKCPDVKTAGQMIFGSMLELQVLAVFLPLEALACLLFPPFPRALAGTLVRLYCDIACIFDAAESIDIL